DRAEVEAVDDRRRAPAGLLDAPAPRLVLLHGRGPRDMVDGARPALPSCIGLVVSVERAASVAANLVAAAVLLEAERPPEEAAALLWVERVGANAVEALQRILGRDLRTLRDQWLVVRLDHAKLE